MTSSVTGSVRSPYSSEQISAWLRGLLTIAWADGDFNEDEKNLIAGLTQTELAPRLDLAEIETIAPAELAASLGNDADTAENFLRTAVMVAIADGRYSPPEDEALLQFCQALGQKPDVLANLRQTLCDHPADAPPHWADGEEGVSLNVLQPVKHWLDDLEIHDPRVARFICKMVPPQCPFERDVVLFGKKIVHIPAMCKLNPLYDQLVGLRFRALSYLADECGEDVTPYLGENGR
jgi:tellurite resistance protein